MNGNVNLLQTEYLIEIEKARLNREANGDYTKEGLRHLLQAARVQFSLASLMKGESAQQHQKMGYQIAYEVKEHMLRLGLLEDAAAKEHHNPIAGELTERRPVSDEKNEDSVASSDSGDALEELNALIGLDEVKTAIAEKIKELRTNIKREELGVKKKNAPLHMVFVGSAGTGKTTVARLVARIYKQMGMLSRGHLVEASASDLIAGYVGQSTIKTHELIERAKGGVLFIDEAYTLAESKFGKEEAIPELLLGMENNRDDLAVIVAGYTENMRCFIESNEGLRSRFLYTVRFEDYTPENLQAIFESMCDDMEQKMTESARRELEKQLKVKAVEPGFGNGRGVRNLFDKTNLALACRISDMLDRGEKVDRDVISTIEKGDILAACADPNKI